MLQRILELMDAGEAQSQRELAQALGVTEPLLNQMIEQLVARGYLIEDTLCYEGCPGCALQKACGSYRVLRMWLLTPKGHRRLDNAAHSGG